jgi:hypothetical protein
VASATVKVSARAGEAQVRHRMSCPAARVKASEEKKCMVSDKAVKPVVVYGLKAIAVPI